MKRSMMMVLATAALPLAACASTQDSTLASAGTGAAIGAAVGGLGGAVWADANNDGCVDGYMREGRYYEGAPVAQPMPATYRSGERG